MKANMKATNKNQSTDEVKTIRLQGESKVLIIITRSNEDINTCDDDDDRNVLRY